MKCFLPKMLSAVLFTAIAPLSMGAGNANFDPATGTLTISAVDFNGVKRYENVELKLNMATGTFAITKAIPADTRIPELPVQEITKTPLKIGLRGCVSSSQEVTCHLILTAVGSNISVRLGGDRFNQNYWETSVFDNLGNAYHPSSVSISNINGTASVEQDLIANVPTAATITIENVSADATGFSSIIFRVGDASRFLGAIAPDFEFKNVPF